jgi:hypothetical protein
MINRTHICFLFLIIGATTSKADEALRSTCISTMRTAAEYYRNKVSNHAGYVYHYSPDLKVRWGEGQASASQIWVQPPGTPTVGLAYLHAYRTTRDAFYLDAATAAAEALVYGQLKSGGWTNSIDFDPKGRVALYRNGKGRGKNNSSLDDGQTQSALRFLIETDAALAFRNKKIHDAAVYGLDALLSAQFPNGAFPQVWTGPVRGQSASTKTRANYPTYDWKTEGRIKEYWNMYTLNDNVCGYVTDTLIVANRVYGGKKFDRAIRRLGDFLIASQMPEPQPGWAQQYNLAMQPIWARKFEPPAVSGDESQEVIETLFKIYQHSGDRKYLAPVPKAIAYLERSLLPVGQLARYYELKTNRPLYMQRRGKQYSLTYDDSKLPKHYGWKSTSRLADLKARHKQLIESKAAVSGRRNVNVRVVKNVVASIDTHGRWMSKYEGERLVGQPKFELGSEYLSSEVFSQNLVTLSEYISQTGRN